ncbi:MAG: TraB/GumN family protein [Kordiimonas sp.]
MPSIKGLACWITKIWVTITLSLLLLAGPSSAQNDPSPAIWKITDHDSTIWLFGTIHILNPTLKWRSQQVNQAFSSADIVYFETPADQQAMQPLVMQYGVNKGTTLSAQMSATGRANLKRALQSLGMPLGVIQQLEPLKPWLAGLTMAAFQIQAQGGDPEAGVERILQAEAKQIGKRIGYLETDEQQIQMLAGLSEQAQLYFLEDGLRMMIEEPQFLTNLIDGWVKGDVDRVDAAMLQSMQQQQELYAAILVNRNKNWAAQIKTIMDGSGTAFIAVGAGHLAGGNSVQYYLGDYGLTAVRQ